MANTDRTNVAATARPQASSNASEQDNKTDNTMDNTVDKNDLIDEDGYPKAAKDDEPIFFDTTIAKLVKRENSDGEEEWVEVMSDNLYPGEKLKRADDDKKAAEKSKQAQEDATGAADARKASK